MRLVKKIYNIIFCLQPSRGGLEVERSLRIQLKAVTLASVGSNPSRDSINRSEVERLCRNAECRAPANGSTMNKQPCMANFISLTNIMSLD